MRQLHLLTLFATFSCCAVLVLSTSGEYFKYKRKFRTCAILESQYGSAGSVREILPVGYTFFTGRSSNTTYTVNEIMDQCRLKSCTDGAFQADCMRLSVESVLSFENENVSLICTCKTEVPEIFQEKNFDQNLTGVVFSPYVKNWHGLQDGNNFVSKWNNYTMEEVKTLISVLATTFSHFSTYGMGATATSRTWDEGDSTGFVPVAAAEVNKILKAKGMRTVTVTQGIYQNSYPDILEQEIQNSFTAAEDANRIFPGTVTGIIFTSDFVSNDDTANQVTKMIDKHKTKTEELRLKIGVRLNNCIDVLPVKLSESDNNLHSVPTNYTYAEFSTTELKSIFTKLLERVDFLICAYGPPAFLVGKPMEDVIREYGQSFLKIQRILKAVNPNVTLVGQGGWASWGVSSNGASNSLANLVEFWNRMNKWAVENQFHLDMFEAFDEPWKTDVNDKTSLGPNGPTGAEGNYGWWKRQDSELGNFYTYVPKFEELESLDEEGDSSNTPKGIGSITLALVTIIIVVLVVTAYLIWRLRKSKMRGKLVSDKTAYGIAQEFRNGASISGTRITEKDQMSSDKPVEVEGKSFVYALRFPYDTKYELSKKKFTIDENCILGQGNYGIVYKGTIDGIPGGVAFKTLNSNGSIIELKNLLSEIKIMAFVGSHEHIVNLLGAYTAKIEQGIIHVGTEYCELGSLEAYLKAQRGNFQESTQTPVLTPTLSSSNYVVAYFAETDPTPSPFIIPQKILTPADLFKWGYQIACGMEHIAKKKVIHSDLATRNVLLTGDGTAKIADFGLSRQLYYQCEYLKSNTKEELPWRWLSLESLRSLVFSVESDVWTFGITMWEVFSLAELPYPGVPGWTPSFLHELEVNNYRMDPPRYASHDIYDVMLKCWLSDPSSRPSFTALKETLHEKMQSILATPVS